MRLNAKTDILFMKLILYALLA